MRRRLMLGVVLVSLALAVAPSIEGVEHGAAGVDAAWVKAMKANDLDGVLKCYAKDAVLWFPGAPTARGDKEIRAAYEGLLGANTVKDAALMDVTYRTSGKTSTAWGRFSMTLAPKAGGDPMTMTGRFTEVAEQRGGRWVYIVDHASADPAKP
jgi:uncharacterized protein (TIGR02246 family)